MPLTMEQARYVVRCMDLLAQHHVSDPQLAKEQTRLRAMYMEYGRWTEGAERSRAQWLLDYLNLPDAEKPTAHREE